MCNGVANLNVPVLIYTRSPILPDPRNPCWSHTQCSYDPCMTHYAKLIGSTEPSLGRQTAVGSLLRRGGLGTVHWAGWKARKGTQWCLLEYQAKTLLCRVLSSHLVSWRPAWISYPPFYDRPYYHRFSCLHSYQVVQAKRKWIQSAYVVCWLSEDFLPPRPAKKGKKRISVLYICLYSNP